MSELKNAQSAIEDVLKIIIDEWYEKVSSFYVTAEQIAEEGGLEEGDEELKRFHDENGHRIKFSKDELDFTYGLRAYVDGGALLIEVSVNNKVENFNIEEFRTKLKSHYLSAGNELLPTPYELKTRAYNEVFQIDSRFEEAFKVDIRKGKADIMRLSFHLAEDSLDKLVARPVSSKEIIENYCVTPFRNIYASIYRRSG